MKERKKLNVSLPTDVAEEFKKVKELRSKQEGRRITWDELVDEAVERYIACAKEILAGLEKGEEDNGR